MQQRRFLSRAIALAAISLILCAPVTSLGWGPGGHMMVARIAFGRLNPRAKAQVAKLLAIKVTRPGLSPKSKALLAAANAKTKDFVNAAHWADDLKSIPEFDSFKELHFIDTP